MKRIKPTHCSGNQRLIFDTMIATILITGANGQLGSKLVNIMLADNSFRIRLTDKDTLDITDAGETKQFVSELSPDWIINCAGYTAVDRAEEEPESAMKINRDGVTNLTNGARAIGARLIHISTDFVFDGNKASSYNEDDLVSPISAYGRSKAEGEAEAMKYEMSLVIRTSWLYSDLGTNFVKTIIRLASERDEIRVVDDQRGTPTSADDLAVAIIKIIKDVENGRSPFYSGIFNYTNSGHCSWYEFAAAIITATGKNTKTVPITTDEYPAAAKRPAMSVLDTSKIRNLYGVDTPPWKKSLKLTVEKLKNRENEK